MSKRRVEKSESEWKAQLAPMEFAVTRQAATERAFTGRYWDHHDAGQYRCVCCSSAADVERFLQPMMDEDEETRMEARGLNIPLDGDGGRC